MIEIVSEPLTSIEIGVTGIREIYQNVQTILSTPKGSVFLDRHFGIDNTIIDSPSPVAIMRFRNEVVNQIEEYEPRVQVLSVTFTEDVNDAGEGIIKPVVKIKIRDGVLL